jgi:tetratricopeptide (TPR) repeat protein
MKYWCILFLLTGFYSYGQDTRGIDGGKVAQPAFVTGQTYALIVGVSNYKQVPSLHFADRDAKAFEQFLLSDAGGKIPTTNIETFLNERATRNNVGDAMSVIVRKAKPGDRVYFYFAGHGDMEDLTQTDNGLLLLYNSPNGNYFGMTDDVVQILNLKLYLSPLAEKGVDMIFVIDACHAGNLAGGVKGTSLTATALAAAWGKEFKILACQPDQLSEENKNWGGGRGLFSWWFEQGAKGLADKNNDGYITLFELQKFLQDSVTQVSEQRQIPVLTGNLARKLFKVNADTLASLKKQSEENYRRLAGGDKTRGVGGWQDSLKPASRLAYDQFEKHTREKALVWPLNDNALRDFRRFQQLEKDNPLEVYMRRALAAGLNERFDSIVTPQLRGETSYSTKDACYYAGMELDSCLQLLGAEHYMYPNLKARKLYMDAMTLTWALGETDYNVSIKPTVERALQLLEESEKLEPNVAYTQSALGTHYYMLNDFDKAFKSFNKYITLRPNDFFAKYSLVLLYMKLKVYDKATPLVQRLLTDFPDYTFLNQLLFECYFYSNRKPEALDIARRIAVVDTVNREFTIGIYHALEENTDSAIYYYQKVAAATPGCGVCFNNIGHSYFMAGQNDSARHYFEKSVVADSIFAGFPLFNLASIDVQEKNYSSAINGFLASYERTPSMKEAFFARFDMYFNKRWVVTDSSVFREFQKKSLMLELQYMDVLSMFYCVLRDTANTYKPGIADTLFRHMLLHKTHEAFSWYHYACYRALQHDEAGALQSLEKSLSLGFGYYGMMACDGDLDLIRNTTAYINLVKKYFPDAGKKRRR